MDYILCLQLGLGQSERWSFGRLGEEPTLLGHVVGYFCVLNLSNTTATYKSVSSTQHRIRCFMYNDSPFPQTLSMELTLLSPWYQWGN